MSAKHVQRNTRRRPLVLLAFFFFCIYVALVSRAYRTVPLSNTSQTHFDVIIVLGTPSNTDGSPSPEQCERVLAGVDEYHRNVADTILMTGGAAHNSIVEAHTMALFAESLGVPATAVVEEGQARNTIENIFYSMAILRSHSWTSAEIVSSPAHLPRASLIMAQWNKAHVPLLWRTQAAAWPQNYPFWYQPLFYTREALECWRIRTFGFTPDPHLPS